MDRFASEHSTYQPTAGDRLWRWSAAHLASQKASQGFVAGIDHSAAMVRVASKRNADAIKSLRMELGQGDAGSIPYPDDSFDIVFSVHSIYFWKDAIQCLKGFRRVLKPGGLLAITIQPKNRWRQEETDPPGMTLFFGDQIKEMFSSAGFHNIQMESYTESGETSLECILGSK
ncbi:MAG: class I SAM-dependent methyltransferase [Chloroflexota bacterium]